MICSQRGAGVPVLMAEIWLDESEPMPENNLLCCKCMWWGIIFGPLSGSELYSVRPRIWAGNFPLVNIPLSRDQQVCQYLSFPQLSWTQLCIKRSEGQWNCLSSLKKKNSPALRRLVITGWAVCVRAEMCRVCAAQACPDGSAHLRGLLSPHHTWGDLVCLVCAPWSQLFHYCG